MKKILLLFNFAFCILNLGNAQNIGIGTTTPDISALLELKSNTKGLLIPRMTTRERGSIVPAPEGLLVFDTDTKSFWFQNNGWHELNIWLDDFGGNIFSRNSGNTGIGVLNPVSGIHLAENRDVLFGLDTAGAGSKLKWISSKAALRAGNLLYRPENWNFDSIGVASAAFGQDTKAKGDYSFAAGYSSEAAGTGSIAIGSGVTASGNGSIAIGSTVFSNPIASGDYSVAIGSSMSATGSFSTAIGNRVHSINNGSFVFGSGPGNSNDGELNSSANFQLTCGFQGGYKFFTGSQVIGQIFYSYGAELLPNATSWSTMSDRNKKENFLPVNEEDILEKIKLFNLSTWNYKGLDVSTERHYGPMAQDFYAAFGKDALGKIGNDTTINEHDFSSINFMAIQGLEKRTQKIEELLKENAALKLQNERLLTAFEKLNEKVELLTKAKEKNNLTLVTKNK